MTTKATTKGMLDLAQVLSKNVSTMATPKKVLSPNDLSPDQRVCYDGVMTWLNRGSLTKPTLTLGGYGGTGKSTVVSVLAHELLRGGQVAFCAFTGKAASVLSRKLSASGIATTSKVVRKSLFGGGPLFEGRPYCGTIHGLVYRPCDICMVDEQYEHNYGSRCREKENDDKELSPEERDEAAVAADPFANVAPLTSAPCLACDPPKPKRATNGPCLRCNNARYLRRDRLDRHYSLIVVDECFHYAQRILTEDGWQTIGKIVTRKIPCRVWALNKATFQLELKPIVRWLKKPAPKELLRINAGRTDSMRSARVIRCTPAHKILTPSGYVRAGTLKVGDSLVVRGRHLTPLQFSVLVGSMLGDGSMGRHETRNSPQPYLMQGEDQLDWLKFKKAVFGEDMTGELQRGKSGYGPKIVWRFTVNVTDQARRVAEQMPWNTGQRNGRRYWTPTETFLSWVDEVALAVWYLDDGSLDVRDGRVVRAALHTECFSEETNGRLAAFLLRRFGLTAVPTPDGKGNLFLRFVQAEAERLLSIVTPFVPACMARKAPGACYAPPFVPAGEVTVAPIRAIMPTQGRARGVAYVYDLEVADHHNYIAGNVVVSNCSMVSDDILDTLLQFRVPILAVGDHGQLPPVKGAGTLMRAPDLRLETIHRQAADSPIIALSARIRETGDIDDALEDGEAFFTMAARDLDDWIAKRFPPSRLLIDPRPPEGIMGTALISWTNRARVNLNRDVRDALGCKGKPPMKGEAVICLKNNAPIYNGMRGVLMVNADAAGDKRAPKWRCSVDFIEDGQEAIDILTCEEQYFSEKTIDFDTAQKMGVSMSKLGELYDFGYSMTCHKMQGSQVHDVGVYVEPGLSRLSRDERTRWLYTAITRAEKVLTVIR